MNLTNQTELVHCDTANSIATITLDSPTNRNALSSQLIGELIAHLETAGESAEVRAVVLTHTESTFCAGADLAEGAREGGPAAGTERLVTLLRRILTLPKPVVALIDGKVRAGGMGLLGACDVVIASTPSTFAFTEARLGLAPAIISLTLLSRLDERAAARYFLTGEVFEAAMAERIGLVTEAGDDPTAITETILEAFRKSSPQGLAESKRLVVEPMLTDFDERAAELVERSARLFASDDAREGIAAFMERRPPRWADE